VYKFTSPPPTGSTRTVTFAAYGDLGESPFPASIGTIERVLARIKAGETEFVLHIGDLSYACGNGIGWDLFGKVIEPVATAVPYMVSTGNRMYKHAHRIYIYMHIYHIFKSIQINVFFSFLCL
jgi:hypothetical protein